MSGKAWFYAVFERKGKIAMRIETKRPQPGKKHRNIEISYQTIYNDGDIA